MSRTSNTPRLLIVPGLHDSGPAHWQTWLQAQYREACRVQQRRWVAAMAARLAKEQRPARASFVEWSFAV
jgi:predicted alpha/beta hydrolase family esterase